MALNPKIAAKPTPADFDTLVLRLASPEKIREWSYGEVTKPETINYRTQRSEKNGLFDERIFGPEKDFECYCGKYKGIRYRGIICEKCGVEITRSIVRRERMGHISLASPVAHIWFLRNVPARIALLLGASSIDVEKVVYFAAYIIRSVAEDERTRLLKDLETEYKTKGRALHDEKSKEKLKEAYVNAKREILSIVPGKILDDMTYSRFSMKYGGLFEGAIGAESLYQLCKELDIVQLSAELEGELTGKETADKKKTRKRLSLVRSMIRSGIRPEWMFLTTIPIIPAALRPMVALDGGRHATSDLNDLYRRVINRNNRLKKLLDIHAPNVILRNEKRILQEAVDALIDNAMRHGSTGGAINQAQRRPLKSLSDNLKGKQGLFRQNLLGKRVDYSGRSVIVVGPELKLDHCGLPKHMALELFKPFVISQLLERELAYNIRGAGRLIDEGIPEVWGILEDVIKDKYVLLNRAPTLHRLGIQAFKPTLIEGNAIQIHPLVVQAYNADFDGDQMAVHVPLSEEAQAEAREIMAANKNLLRPGNGTPIISVAHHDIILGCYWTTSIIPGEKGEGKYFSSPNVAITSYDFGAVTLRSKIIVLPTNSPKYAAFEGKHFETCVGRLLFNTVLPSDYPFLNKEITKGEMAALINELIVRYGNDAVMEILDKIKAFGFKYATVSGTTFGYSDVVVPEGKQELIDAAFVSVDAIARQYEEGLLSEEERLRMNTEIWHGVRTEMEKLVQASLPKHGSLYDMWASGARGSVAQITNMAGMKGLIQGSKGRVLEFPILSSSKEGLNPSEYFTTTHGSRKGLGDTALNTSQSGYLTRRLFDVAQDIVVNEEDCATKEGIVIRSHNLAGIAIPMVKNIEGRFLAKDVVGKSGEILFSRNDYIDSDAAKRIEEAGISEVNVRSPMTCEMLRGVCVRCYGKDFSTNKPVDLGEAVGTVAAQSIGEPATQLTMRTFHAGGTAAIGGDITTGLPRVEEIFERRPPKNPAVIAEVSGLITAIDDTGREKVITVLAEGEKKGGEMVYTANVRRVLLVKVGDTVEKGQVLTDGSVDISDLFTFAGKEKAQEYIIVEISKIYELQAASVARKHIEVIIKQMFSRVQIVDPGDTDFSDADIVEIEQYERENARMKDEGKKRADAVPRIMGITNVALSRQSFLSSASFQHTTKILIDSAIHGREDDLKGLKESVIIGRLIPAGTGFEGSAKKRMITDLQKTLAEKERFAGGRD